MAGGLAALRMLVVDDNPQMRTIVGTVLLGAGVRQIHYAPDGWQGLEAIRQFDPDVCFVDYEMPVMDGLEFISTVRSPSSAHRFLPIIMLTGYSDRTRVIEARDRGMTEFLGKPVTARDILSRLEAVIFKARPFVDSPSYFGPDRRRPRRDPYSGPRRRRSDYEAALEL
jgi:two-component system chemotaxis response regulator CheY